MSETFRDFWVQRNGGRKLGWLDLAADQLGITIDMARRKASKRIVDLPSGDRFALRCIVEGLPMYPAK